MVESRLAETDPRPVDPVCGMEVDPERAAATVEHGTRTYYFCCEGCANKFRTDPEGILRQADAASLPVSGPSSTYFCPMCPDVSEPDSGSCPSCGMALEPDPESLPSAQTEYTCPMHPEVTQSTPGSCPICGMALEARSVSVVEEDNPELETMLRRFWISTALTIPVFLLAMSEMIPGRPIHALIPMATFQWIQFLLATPVVLWGGWPFFQRGWQSIVHRSPNMFTLIAMGIGASYFYSLVAITLPGVFPLVYRGRGGEVGVYFEAAAVITVLVLLGQVLELRARSQTGGAIRGLLNLAPATARRLDEGREEQDIPLAEVQPGDRLLLRPGERVPVDAVVLEGESSVDESAVTGEVIPSEKHQGDGLIGGTVNGTGSLLIEARRVGRDTVLARIVQMVSAAQRSRAPIQRLADRTAAYFVPGVVIAALATALAWGLFGPEPSWTFALVNAAAVLLIACPCALGLASPMAVMVGVGRGAQQGVLIKDAESLETLSKIDALVVDKTGTLTEGKPTLAKVVSTNGFTDSDVLRTACSLEQRSEHPLATAIVEGAGARRLPLSQVSGFRALPGQGVTGQIEGKKVMLGNRSLLEESRIPLGELERPAELLHQEGQTVMFLTVADHLAGLLSVADTIRTSTPRAVSELRAEGVRIMMLTGDNPVIAAAVARKLDIQELRAEILPHQKAETVKDLQQQGFTVAMAGDGINDAPALAQADVGIAMGTGTDVAIESAGVALIGGDLGGIVRARRLSRATVRNIRQNLFFAFVYNTLGIPIAAGLLYPFFGLLLSPMMAAAAMSFSSVSVIANALRLRRLAL